MLLIAILRNITADFISQYLAIISLLFPMRDTIDRAIHKVLKPINCLVIVVGAVERDNRLAVCIKVPGKKISAENDNKRADRREDKIPPHKQRLYAKTGCRYNRD